MTIASKVAALLDTIRRQDLEALPPVERRRFADLCRYVAGLAEPQDEPAKGGGRYDPMHETRKPGEGVRLREPGKPDPLLRS